MWINQFTVKHSKHRCIHCNHNHKYLLIINGNEIALLSSYLSYKKPFSYTNVYHWN